MTYIQLPVNTKNYIYLAAKFSTIPTGYNSLFHIISHVHERTTPSVFTGGSFFKRENEGFKSEGTMNSTEWLKGKKKVLECVSFKLPGKEKFKRKIKGFVCCTVKRKKKGFIK